jgi:hypothetical protein
VERSGQGVPLRAFPSWQGMTRKMIPQDSGATLARALVIETIFFFLAAAVSIGFTAPYADHKQKILSVIALNRCRSGTPASAISPSV